MSLWALGLCVAVVVTVSACIRAQRRNRKAREVVRQVLNTEFRVGEKVEAWTDCGKGRFEKRIGRIKKGPRLENEVIYLTICPEYSERAYKKPIVVIDENGTWAPSCTQISRARTSFGS
jgi:hypothetical protein